MAFFRQIFPWDSCFLLFTWIAKDLGPEQYGTLTYTQDFVALFAAAGSLGLDGIVVRDLVKFPEAKSEILGTTFFLRLGGGILAAALATIGIKVLSPNDPLTQLIVAIINGMAEAFVKTFKRDYVNDLHDAKSVMEKLGDWFNDYNEKAPHKGLRMMAPREYLRQSTAD